jgi:hypothetical protein
MDIKMAAKDIWLLIPFLIEKDKLMLLQGKRFKNITIVFFQQEKINSNTKNKFPNMSEYEIKINYLFSKLLPQYHSKI